LVQEVKPVPSSRQSIKLINMMNRENALAATWASAYSVSLVLSVALFDHLAVKPFYYVPIVIVVLPFAVALALSPLRTSAKRGQS